jgi:branched-chain amino acid transport system ATP-binding protein
VTVAAERSTALAVSDLRVSYGGVHAVDGVTAAFPVGIAAVVGPNGAGKTTLFNAITGYVPVAGGEIFWQGRSLRGSSPQRLRRLGLSRTFQHLELFGDMTVRENVMVGLHFSLRHTVLGAAIRSPAARREQRAARAHAAEAIAAVGLDHMAERRVADLPYGTRKLVALARALVGEPLLLLLDEPASGLGDGELLAMHDLLGRLAGERGVSILFIEHNIGFVADLAQWVLAMDDGRAISTGSPTDVFADEVVIESYLGR